MKLHRFIGDFDFSVSPLKIVDKDFLHQAWDVLRLKVGEKIILNNGKLQDAVSRITDLKKDFAEVEILEIKDNDNEPEIDVVLFCSILKGDHFELVVEKATEIGVKEIVPLITKYTVKSGLRRERLEKIIKEAAEQSGRGIMPKLHDTMNYLDAVEYGCRSDVNLLFDPDTKFPNIKEAKFGRAKRVGVFIGPEGGWAKEELTACEGRNVQIVNLGRLSLRAETAAIVASYLVVSQKR